MVFSAIDVAVFVAFILAVITIGLLKSRREKTSEGYFLAGRGLHGWLIGFSLIAANISTEQFVGMSGNAASHVGLAIASYEWMAAITLVVVAFGFLPHFLRAGIYTMPEFLEYRFDAAARTLMAAATIFIYLLLLGSVTYSGALTIRTLAGMMGYDVPLSTGSAVIGVIAMLYVTAGGLRACAWADLIQGSALILGGMVVMYFAFMKLGAAPAAACVLDVASGSVGVQTLPEGQGALSRFFDLNANRLNMFLPADDAILPWTALLLGLWIPNFYYWGLNQYITQRMLGSASLAEGQRGIVFAAFLKLLIPFVVVIPGIIAFNLYAPQMRAEAARDNAVTLAKYAKANRHSKMVEVLESPAEGAAEAWPGEKYALAIYLDPVRAAEAMGKNPHFLPMAAAEFEQIEVSPFTVFVSEDAAWRHVNEALAVEVTRYNEMTTAAATTDGTAISTEKFIAYKYDTALGLLLGNVLPQKVGLLGFVLAALLGAVVSSLAAMLNAASTIFSMDVFKKFLRPAASQGAVVLLGRFSVVVFTAVAILVAPQLGNPKISNSIFTIIQESQGFISPGILAVFLVGFLLRRAPPLCGTVGLLTNIAAYGALKVLVPSLQFLNRMAVCFGLCLLVMLVMTWIKPLRKPVEFERRTTLELKSSKGAMVVGMLVVLMTIGLYIVFSPLVLAK